MTSTVEDLGLVLEPECRRGMPSCVIAAGGVDLLRMRPAKGVGGRFLTELIGSMCATEGERRERGMRGEDRCELLVDEGELRSSGERIGGECTGVS